MLAFLTADVERAAGKPSVKISPAPICLLAIRSLRTNWSRMENIRCSATLGALLWILGVPLPLILLIALFWHH